MYDKISSSLGNIKSDRLRWHSSQLNNMKLTSQRNCSRDMIEDEIFENTFDKY